MPRVPVSHWIQIRPRRLADSFVRARLGVLRCALVGLLLLLISDARVSQGQDLAKEYKVKLAYLYNFIPYVDWPAGAFGQADRPMIVGVLGDDPFGSLLERAGTIKKPKGRSVEVHRFRTWKQYRPCHVLFISKSVTANARKEILQKTASSPVLVITESSGAAAAGSTINFFLDTDGTVGFEINIDAAHAHKLKMSAKLLKLARIVRAAALE